MRIYNINIPNNKSLTNFDLEKYAELLGIYHFRGVFMRDTLPAKSYKKECGIVNFNLSSEVGSHWVCYLKHDNLRIYFDSYGQAVLFELQKYLKTGAEYKLNQPVIQRNTDIVQRPGTVVCGHLCLKTLVGLTRKHLTFQEVLTHLNHGYTQGDW